MYNRLFTKILDSSIWLESLATRVVWITLLAAMDEDGFASFACAENVARRAGVELAEAEAALACLMAPDANSSDPDNEGRRLEKIPGGYIVLNAAKYRLIFSREIRREQTRRRVEKHRKTKDVTLCNADVTLANAHVTQSEAEAEAQSEEKTVAPSASPPKPRAMTDAEWTDALKANPAYAGIDVMREYAKCSAWCGVNQKAITRRRFVNWLNRCEVPIVSAGKPPVQPNGARTVLLGRELERVENAIRELDRQSMEPSGLTPQDRVNRKELKLKRENLRAELGLTA